MSTYGHTLTTPLGKFSLIWDAADARLRELHFGALPKGVRKAAPPPALAPLVAALTRYFAGKSLALPPPPLDDLALTDFTRRVMQALVAVPPGQTRTYAELARAAGRPGAARAVGNVMARNPWPILVPCHRAVAANGLGGFSAGLPLKRRLLAHEGAALPTA